jgi:hypothetical protein
MISVSFSSLDSIPFAPCLVGSTFVLRSDIKPIKFLLGEYLYRISEHWWFQHVGPVVTFVIVSFQLVSRSLDLVTFTRMFWVVSSITLPFMLWLYAIVDRRVLWLLSCMPEFLLVQSATIWHALLSAYFLMSHHDDIITYCGGNIAPLASRWFWQVVAFMAIPLGIAVDSFVTRGRFKNIFAVVQLLSCLNAWVNYMFVNPYEPWIRPVNLCVYGAVCVDVSLTRSVLILFLIVESLRNLYLLLRYPKAMTYIWADISFAVTPVRR